MTLEWKSEFRGHGRARYDYGTTPDGGQYRVYAPLLDALTTCTDENGREQTLAGAPAFRNWREARVWCEDHYDRSKQAPADPDTNQNGYLSKDELINAIEAATGNKPDGRTSRDKLMEMYQDAAE